MASSQDVKEACAKIDTALKDFKASHDERLGNLDATVEGIEAKLNRSGLAGGGSSASNSTAPFNVQINGQSVPVFCRGDKLSDRFPAPHQVDDRFNLADFVRVNMGIGDVRAAVTSGAATIPTFLESQIIDAVRAQAAVVKAGSLSIVIDGPSNICRITGDPVVHQHTEGASDISESDATFAAVALNPKALVAAVPLSAEIVADSPNLDLALMTSLSGAFAKKLDVLCLATILADANIPTSSVGQDPATWAGVLDAVSQALAADMEVPGSLISSPADFIARAGELASTAGMWLGAPRVLENMADLATSHMTAGTAVFGDFERGFAIALRQGLRLDVVRFGNHASYSHILVAHSRMDGVVLQPGRLFVQKKTVV